MKRIIYLLFAVALFSCNSPLDKSIFEPLSVEELKKSIEKDSLFKNTYECIVYVRDTVLKSDMEKVKFADLTYERIHDFVEFSSDTTYFNPIGERIEKEWKEKYGIYKDKVDSVSNYWKKYKEENSIEQYVKVELVEIDKEYCSDLSDIRNVNLGFRLTPLKGKIEQIRFGYSIEAKIDEKDKEDIYSSIYSSLDKSWCLITSPFSRPVVRYWEANYTNEKILKYETLETLLRDYNIYIEIDVIRKDGKNLSNDDLNIPVALENHWKYENKEYLQDLHLGNVVKEVLHKEYMEEYKYCFQEIDKIWKEKDSLVFEFLTLPMNKE